MSDESVPENKPTVDKGSAESNVARTWKMLETLELVGGSPRQIVDGGLLGVCIAVLIALFTIQQKDIDTHLNTALFAFVVAIPPLAYGFLFTFYKRPRIVPHSGPSNLFAAMCEGAWVAEGIGWIATYIGIVFVIWHISVPVLIAFVSSCAFVLLVLPILATIGLAVYAVREYKKEDEKQQETRAGASGEAPTQTQQTT